MIAFAFIVGGVLFCIIAYVLNYTIVQLTKYKDLNKLPGPSSLELLKETFSNRSTFDKYHYVSNLSRRYGPILKLWMKPFEPIVIVSDIEIMDKILLSRDHITKTLVYDMVKPFVGEGMGTTSKADIWRRDRKICNTAFQPAIVNGFLPVISRHTDKFLEILKNRAGEVVDMQPLVHLYSLDVIFECMAKHGQNFQGNKNPTYLDARVEFFVILSKRMYSVFLQSDFLFWLSKYFAPMHRSISVMQKFTRDIIETEATRRKDGSSRNSRMYLIDVLFENNIRINDLVDQINTFIIAGHDTVGQSICFTLYEISKHPKVQQKLYEEIVSVVGEDGEITNEDLSKMTYLEAIIKESLRLRAVIPVIERKISYGIDINGVHYPEGTRFMFHFQAIHTSPKYFTDPEKFNPDRFLPENAHLITRHSFIPFSIGPRDCIGRLFALLELKYFLAAVIQKMEVIPFDRHNVKIVNEFITKSINGLPVIFKERSN